MGVLCYSPWSKKKPQKQNWLCNDNALTKHGLMIVRYGNNLNIFWILRCFSRLQKISPITPLHSPFLGLHDDSKCFRLLLQYKGLSHRGFTYNERRCPDGAKFLDRLRKSMVMEIPLCNPKAEEQIEYSHKTGPLLLTPEIDSIS